MTQLWIDCYGSAPCAFSSQNPGWILFLGQKQERRQKSASLLELLRLTKLETHSQWLKHHPIIGTGEHIDTLKYSKKFQIKNFKLKLHVIARERWMWEKKCSMLQSKSEGRIWESWRGKGPSPNLPLCYAGVFLAEHVSTMSAERLTCILCLSPAVAVWISASHSSSLFLQLANSSFTRALLCCRVQLTVPLLKPLRSHRTTVTSLCSLSWKKGKQWIPWGYRGSRPCITGQSYPMERTQNHGLERSWQKSGITFWTVETKASQSHIPQDNESKSPLHPLHVICPGKPSS